MPTPGAAGRSGGIGHGLQLVEELADDWGVERTAVGKDVWFEVELAAKDRLRSH
jgi:hypothetical protein